jgi:hypothetical protein
MVMTAGKPATGYSFNNMQEIKSHSSILYNERLAILFYILDMKSIQMNTYFNVSDMLYVRSVVFQIYKNIRTLIRNNPTMRATLNLDTKDEGTYITDFAFGLIDNMVKHCEINGYTTKQLYIIIQEINKVEIMIKDILQYYHYFIRPDFRQKPDIDMATEKYKYMADERTIDELREIVGKKHKVDFSSLGKDKVELVDETDPELEYEEPEEEMDELEDGQRDQGVPIS